MDTSKINIAFVKKISHSLQEQKEIVHNKNSRKNRVKLNLKEYNKTIIIWSLSNYKGKMEYNGIDWQYLSSGKELNNGISYEIILPVLNSENIFENYLPKDKDILKIRLKYIHPEKDGKSRPYINNFISFVYDKEWRLNRAFEHAHNSYEIIAEGEIIIS